MAGKDRSDRLFDDSLGLQVAKHSTIHITQTVRSIWQILSQS